MHRINTQSHHGDTLRACELSPRTGRRKLLTSAHRGPSGPSRASPVPARNPPRMPCRYLGRPAGHARFALEADERAGRRPEGFTACQAASHHTVIASSSRSAAGRAGICTLQPIRCGSRVTPETRRCGATGRPTSHSPVTPGRRVGLPRLPRRGQRSASVLSQTSRKRPPDHTQSHLRRLHDPGQQQLLAPPSHPPHETRETF
jgi:hypothetical protein